MSFQMISCKWFVCKTVNIYLPISGLSSDGMEGRILRETAGHPWNSSLPFTVRQKQENLSGASGTLLPDGEVYHYKGNQRQQGLGKRTGDLDSGSEDKTCFQGICH